MSTTLVKPAEVERKWYLLDAAGKSLGHVAAEAAVLLRGKQKVDYTPNVDCGDYRCCHQLRQGCSDRQEGRAEVPHHPQQVHRRPEEGPVQQADG